MLRFVTLLSAFAMLGSVATLAQQTQGSHATAPGATISPEQPKPNRPVNQANQSANLAQTLSRTNGTITPPAVDRGMAKTPPPSTQGNMPVLHPPANVQSK
jgi:hypothetical protein